MAELPTEIQRLMEVRATAVAEIERATENIRMIDEALSEWHTQIGKILGAGTVTARTKSTTRKVRDDAGAKKRRDAILRAIGDEAMTTTDIRGVGYRPNTPQELQNDLKRMQSLGLISNVTGGRWVALAPKSERD